MASPSQKLHSVTLGGRSRHLIEGLSQAQLDAFWCASKGGTDLAGGLETLSKIEAHDATVADVFSRVTKSRAAKGSAKELIQGPNASAISEALGGATGKELTERVDAVLGLTPEQVSGVREAMAAAGRLDAAALGRKRVAGAAARGATAAGRATRSAGGSLYRTADEAGTARTPDGSQQTAASQGSTAPRASQTVGRASRDLLRGRAGSGRPSPAQGQLARARARTAMRSVRPQAPMTVRGWVSSISTRTAHAVAQSAAAAAKGALASLVAVAGPVLAVGAVSVALVLAVLAAASASSGSGTGKVNPIYMDGLPPWVTEEMVYTAVECQEKYGDPAGANIAQMIIESNGGDHMSGLAEKNKNLYGIKGDYDQPEVVGSSSWQTGEEYTPGVHTTEYASFTAFRSHRDCIIFRSRFMLKHSPYSTNPLIQEAIEKKDSHLMFEGLKSAGWATSSSYVASLNDIFKTYDLEKFDHVTTAMLSAGTGGGGGTITDGPVSGSQQAVIDACNSVGSPGAGLCATWISQVYQAAGLGYPTGNANDMYWNWCHSSNRSELKPGMIIAVSTHSHTPMGGTYGHIGFYVGNGQVMDNIGYIRTISVDEWISYYSTTVEVKWGWVYDQPLS